jgi:hypothetical protein
MKKTAIATFAAAFLTTAAALAQSTTTFTLSSDDATKLKTWMGTQTTVTAATAPAGFTAAVGTAVPADIMLYDIPATAGVATVTKYKYAKIGDKFVLVDPADRKIVYVVA